MRRGRELQLQQPPPRNSNSNSNSKGPWSWNSSWRFLELAVGVGVAATRLLAALLTVAAIASAQEASLEVRQVDASGFPTVKLFVSITDANGNPLTDLSPADFKIDESGKEVASPQIPGGTEPVCAFLVIDRSLSMSEGDKMGQAKEAASRFVDMMRPGDKTGIIAFDSLVDVVSQPTDSRDALKAHIRDIRPNGETACYSAVKMALELLWALKGRRSVVVLTDGRDNQSDVRGDSTSSVSRRSEELGIPVFAIGLGEDVQADALRMLAGGHGHYSYAPTEAELVGLFARQAEQIQKEFVLTYGSPNRNPDAKRRDITVTATWHGRKLSGTAAYAPSGAMPGQDPETRSPGSVWGVFLMIAIILGFLGAAPILLKRAQDGAKEAGVPGKVAPAVLPIDRPIPATPVAGRVRVIAPTQAPPLPPGPARVKIIAGTEPPPPPLPTDAPAAPPVAPPAAPRVRILPAADAPPPPPPADAPPPPPPPDPPPAANP